jgi:putative flippase GtrA
VEDRPDAGSIGLTVTLVPLVRRVHDLVRKLLPELTKFGLVGSVGFLVDVGGFNLLRFAGGEGPLYDRPLTAKVLSVAAATVVTWLGNRLWTFRHGRRSAAHSEFLLFALACTIGGAVALSCLYVSHYVLGFTSPLADNLSANGIGLVLGSSFRFWAYRTHVFSEQRDPAPVDEPDEPAASVPG